MIINEAGDCSTRSDNVYFIKNKQASLEVFTAAFYFVHAEHNLNKLQLYNNWLAQVVNNISECPLWNLSKPVKFAQLWKLANQSTSNKAHAVEITKAYTIAFMKARNFFVVRCREKCVRWEKSGRWQKIIYKNSCK